MPPTTLWRLLRISRPTLNSSPRKNSRKMIPSSDTNVVTSDCLISTISVGSFGPIRIPASRYAGIAEMPNRFAIRPSAARVRR